MLVVADTSALLALAVCSGLPLLDSLFQEVRVPPAVFEECTVAGKPEAEHLEAYLRTKVLDVDLSRWVLAVGGVGRGELEAMVLCKQLQADRLLVDDRRARKVAIWNGIEVIGSVGVLVLAKNEGLIPAIRPLLQTIQGPGIHLGEELCSDALELTGER